MSAFQQVREPCVRLSRVAFLPNTIFDPNNQDLLQSLRQLDTILQKLSQDSVEVSAKLADYIFTPIASLLKQNSLTDASIQYILSIIRYLLQLCWSEQGYLQFDLAKQLLPILTYLINKSQDGTEIGKKSREFKDITTKLLSSFIKSLNSQQYAHEFFTTQNDTMPVMAHVVTILLNILINSSQDPDNQSLCIEALSILYNDLLRDGEVLSYILPGNVSNLAKLLITPGRNVNYKVVSQTLFLLESLLIKVYDDIELQAHISFLTDVTDLIGPNGEIKEIENEVTIGDMAQNHRTTSWLHATSAQVNLALRGFIPKLLKRDHSAIQESLVQFATNILKNCSNTLTVCQPILISILLQLQSDPGLQLPQRIPQVKKYITEELKQLQTNVQFDSSKDIKTLNFAIEILSNYSEDGDTLETIINTVLESLDVDNGPNKLSLLNKNEKVIEQSSNVIISDNFNFELPQQTGLRVFNRLTKEMETSLGILLNNIGSSLLQAARLEQVVENFISQEYSSSLTKRAIALWITSRLIEGTQRSASSKSNMDDYLTVDYESTTEISPITSESCFVALECCNDLAREISMTIEGQPMSKQEETAMCIVLSTIETISIVMKDSFKDELIDYLYTVIESLASTSPQVREFAQSCSMVIANELYGGNVEQLISDNMDYLVDSISTKLNAGMTDRVTTVLMVIYKLVGYKAIASFRDILETIFKLLDYYHGYSELSLQFFQLFRVIVIEMKHSYIDTQILQLKDNHLVKSTFSPWGMTNINQSLNILEKESEKDGLLNGTQEFQFEENEPKNFQQYFDKVIDNREADSDDEDEDDEGENDNEDDSGEQKEEEEKWVSPVPLESYKILLQIFSYGDRLLHHNSKPLRIQILEVVKLIIPLLSTQYNSMLPQIAKIWDSVVECSLDKDFSIVKPACECITEMIHYSGDFLSKRFLDFWQLLQSESILLQEVKTHRSINSSDNRTTPDQPVMSDITKYRNFPPIVRNALVSLCIMLLEGISFTDMLLSEVTLEEMLHCCVQVIPHSQISNKSLILGDIIWKITNTI